MSANCAISTGRATPASGATEETVASRLRQAVKRLHGDIERVEFWAAALDRMAEPIPGYDAAAQPLRAFDLPPRVAGAASEARSPEARSLKAEGSAGEPGREA